MNDEIEIESDIPLPPARVPARPLPFAGMKIKDSFYAPCATESEIYRVQGLAYQASIVLKFKFATRRSDGGIRVWRIA